MFAVAVETEPGTITHCCLFIVVLVVYGNNPAAPPPLIFVNACRVGICMVHPVCISADLVRVEESDDASQLCMITII